MAGLHGLVRYAPSSNRLNGRWLIETDCSNHVTCDLSLLTNLCDVPTFPVGLPNAQQVHAILEGNAIITKKITLHHVLYVPSLTCNLISVSQLSDDLNCDVITNSNCCAIQDRQSREVIGMGDHQDGLYYLRGDATAQAVSVDSSTLFELSHNRLRHPSDNVVMLLPFVSNDRSGLQHFCDVFPIAKHHRSNIPTSLNKSTRIFRVSAH